MKVQIKFSEIAVLLVVSLMSFAANLPDGFLGNMLDRRVLLATLTTFVVVAMFRYLRMVLVVAIFILAIGANLPAELASTLGISQLALIISLGFLVAISLLNHAFRLLPTGADEPAAPVPCVDEVRNTMFAAISKGDLATLRQLLAMNVDVNFFLGGATPLHLATEKGYSEIVHALIHHGANFRLKDADGRRPLEIALTKKYIQTTEILFEANKPYFSNPERTVNWRRGAGMWRDAEGPCGVASNQV